MSRQKSLLDFSGHPRSTFGGCTGLPCSRGTSNQKSEVRQNIPTAFTLRCTEMMKKTVRFHNQRHILFCTSLRNHSYQIRTLIIADVIFHRMTQGGLATNIGNRSNRDILQANLAFPFANYAIARSTISFLNNAPRSNGRLLRALLVRFNRPVLVNC